MNNTEWCAAALFTSAMLAAFGRIIGYLVERSTL